MSNKKKLHTKEYIEYDSIYINVENKQNCSVERYLLYRWPTGT